MGPGICILSAGDFRGSQTWALGDPPLPQSAPSDPRQRPHGAGTGNPGLNGQCTGHHRTDIATPRARAACKPHAQTAPRTRPTEPGSMGAGVPGVQKGWEPCWEGAHREGHGPCSSNGEGGVGPRPRSAGIRLGQTPLGGLGFADTGAPRAAPGRGAPDLTGNCVPPRGGQAGYGVPLVAGPRNCT